MSKRIKLQPTPFEFAHILPQDAPVIADSDGRYAWDNYYCDCCGWGMHGGWPQNGDLGFIYLFGKRVCRTCLEKIIFSADWSTWHDGGDNPFYMLDEAINAKRKSLKPNRYISPKVRKALLQDASCKKCGTTERLEIDHVHPVSRGGSNHTSNLQVLCRKCNATKHAKVAK